MGLFNSTRYQRWSLRSLVLKYRLKIGLKDIIDSQYTDQVGPLCARIHKHTCSSADERWKKFRIRWKVCVFIFSQWFSLSDVKSGRVHLTLEWVPTASEAQALDQVGVFWIRQRQICCKWFHRVFPLLCPQVLQFHSRQSFQNKAVPSAALLFVLVEQANGLPVSLHP